MSLQRAQRAIRQLGGFTGGTSRLARPPAPPVEVDIRPEDEVTECATLIGSITGWGFVGITGVGSGELIASDWIETVGSWTWPGLSPQSSPLDATPDYIYQAMPVSGGYLYTRQSADLTTLDLVDPSGVVASWVSGQTESYALAVDASGDYVVVVAEDAGGSSAVNGLYRVTPGGAVTALDTGDATDGISPGAIATTPDGAVWYSRFGSGSGLYRYDGSSTAVTGVPIVTPVPRADSSVWTSTPSGWRSITSGLVVSSDSPCPVLDGVTTYSVAWNGVWSIVAILDHATDDVYSL